MSLPYPGGSLRGDSLVLRKWSMDDLRCVEVASDSGYHRGSTLPVEFTPDRGRDWIERQWARQESGQGLSLAMALAQSNEAVGMIYVGLRGPAGQGALGYWVLPEHQRRGHAFEALGLVVPWLLEETDVCRVVAYVEPSNHQSIGLLTKSGFRNEGLLRSYLRFDEGDVDVFLFSRLRDDRIETCDP